MSPRRRACAMIVALVAPAALPASAAAQREPTLSFSGARVTQAVLADLAYFYRQTVRNPPRFSLVPGAPTTGVADAARGIVDGGLVARELGPGDPPGVVLTPFARSGLCLITNRANPVPNLSRAVVQGLLTGAVTSWAQVPGASRSDAIVPVGVALSGPAAQYWTSVFLDPGLRLAYQPRTFSTTAQVRDFVRATPAAWGYADVLQIEGVHAAGYDGVACAQSTVRDGTYPASRPLGVVTRGQPRGALARFLRWVTTSRKARQVIATRYTAL